LLPPLFPVFCNIFFAMLIITLLRPLIPFSPLFKHARPPSVLFFLSNRSFTPPWPLAPTLVHPAFLQLDSRIGIFCLFLREVLFYRVDIVLLRCCYLNFSFLFLRLYAFQPAIPGLWMPPRRTRGPPPPPRLTLWRFLFSRDRPLVFSFFCCGGPQARHSNGIDLGLVILPFPPQDALPIFFQPRLMCFATPQSAAFFFTGSARYSFLAFGAA